ncbi:MAG TPA: hypothetical protein VJ867_17790 [Gemmatimonadaceae bacterium]|nr:hypothetical protein [Gemmatimonadaceae bacterium]
MTTSDRRARLNAYAPWIFRDYFMNQGPSTAIVVLMIGFLTLLPIIQGFGGERVQLGEVPEVIAIRMLHAMIPPLVFIGAFFATNGIISNDRKLGYYKFLFAKPLSPPLYYGMIFAIYGVGLLVVSAALIGVWWFTVRPMFPTALFAVVFIMYVAYGGIGFLLSAAWRFDWLSLVTVLLVANVGWSVWGAATGPRKWVLYLLPPVHHANEIYGIVARDALHGIPWASIAWLGGYGAACFAAGLIVIRLRSFGTN